LSAAIAAEMNVKAPSSNTMKNLVITERGVLKRPT
jgi:hypothetical protein